MSESILLVGKLAFASVGLAVGVRMAILARREGGFGLHSVALAAIAVGGFGMLVAPAADLLESGALAVVSELGVRVGLLLLCAFIAGTFRPGPVGTVAASACGLLLLASMAWDILGQPSMIQYDYTRWSSHGNQAAVALPFAWSAVESAVLWIRARRRVALELEEPEVAERFLLWTITTACFVAICGLAIANGFALAAGAPELSGAAQATRGLLYGVITVCIWRGVFRHLSAPDATASIA